MKKLSVAYLFFFLGVFGAFPFHWFYLEKVPLIRIFTLNYFFIGAIIDFMKLPQYVSEFNRGKR